MRKKQQKHYSRSVSSNADTNRERSVTNNLHFKTAAFFSTINLVLLKSLFLASIFSLNTMNYEQRFSFTAIEYHHPRLFALQKKLNGNCNTVHCLVLIPQMVIWLRCMMPCGNPVLALLFASRVS